MINDSYSRMFLLIMIVNILIVPLNACAVSIKSYKNFEYRSKFTNSRKSYVYSRLLPTYLIHYIFVLMRYRSLRYRIIYLQFFGQVKELSTIISASVTMRKSIFNKAQSIYTSTRIINIEVIIILLKLL